jgi:glyoxylase-like metal-dependent hydrolase (beta-lactamase superfamily II)
MSRLPKRIAPGVYQVSLGAVNAFLVEVEDDAGGLVLIDTGTAADARRIGQAILDLGRRPDELRGIVITHFHGDHIGGLATVKARTGAEVWMHPADAEAVRTGVTIRQLEPGPGRMRALLVRQIGRRPARLREPIAVEHEVNDGETLPFAGLTAISTPGHSAGHLSLLLPRDGGVLFVGDAATNFGRLSWGPIYEDVGEGERSLRKLAALDFQVAAFAHGRPIRKDAAARFRKRWPVNG